MSSVQCRCGSWVSTQYAAHDGSVMCPKCGTTTWPSAYSGAPTAGYAPANEPNNAAVIGFILAMISFFGCVFTAPFAVYFSIQGMKKEENKGLAIAGLVIGIIQTFVLVGVLIYFIIVALVIAGVVATAATAVSQQASQQAAQQAANQAMVQASEMVATESLFDSVEQQVNFFKTANERWPDQTEGDFIVKGYYDGWGNELVYEPASGSNPVLISWGPDTIPNTGDDLRREVEYSGQDGVFPPMPQSPTPFPSFEPPVSPPYNPGPGPSSVPGGTPEVMMTLDEALVALQSEMRDQQELAARALDTIDVDHSRRADVVKAVLENSNEFGLRSSVNALVKRWASEAEATIVIEHLQSIKENDFSQSADGLVDLMIELGWSKSLVVLANHPQFSLRNRVRNGLRVISGMDELLVEQCVADLGDEARKGHAIELLKDLPVVERLHGDVCRGLNPILEGQGNSLDQLMAKRILDAWGPTMDNFDVLVAARDAASLAKLKNQEALEAIGVLLKDWPAGFLAASSTLREIGPAGESVVWNVLEEGNDIQKIQAIQLLGEIGTERSVSKLEELSGTPVLQGVLMQALERIRAEDRKPETWPAAEESSADGASDDDDASDDAADAETEDEGEAGAEAGTEGTSSEPSASDDDSSSSDENAAARS